MLKITREVNSVVAWVIIGMTVVLVGVLYILSYNTTMRTLDQAQSAQVTFVPDPKILPKRYVYDKDTWTVIKTDTVELKDWNMKMRMPYGYVKSTAFLRDSVEDTYYFADLSTIRESDCRVRYYQQLKATRPGLKIYRYNGSNTTIKINGDDVLIENYYRLNVKDTMNYVILPEDQGSLRKLYKVGDYYIYGSVELPDAANNSTSTQQRGLLCADARVLDADKIFVEALSTLEPLR